MFPIHTILHPTDFSENSSYAFAMACTLAREHEARLIVLHVYPPPISHGEVVARRQDQGYEARLWEMLHQLQPSDPAVRIEYELAEGDPAGEILCVAGEHDCDLIVVGTHGRTGLGRLLSGSVAEKVLRHARCPVLTVKGPPLKVLENQLTSVAEPIKA